MTTASEREAAMIQRALRDLQERCRPLYDLRTRVDMMIPVDLVISDDGTITRHPRPSEQQAETLRRIDEMIAREHEITMDGLRSRFRYASFDELLPNLVEMTVGVDYATMESDRSVAYIVEIDEDGKTTVRYGSPPAD